MTTLVIIPTHDHATTLGMAIDSALDQTIEPHRIAVIGDGVGDDTRDAMAAYASNARVDFFDLAKGERLGERHRHPIILESDAAHVMYLCDDDLLLPRAIEVTTDALRSANFCHPPQVWLQADGSFAYEPIDLGRPEFSDFIRRGHPALGLSGVAHTQELYRQLPIGWHPAPAGMPTDLHFWRQVVEAPSLRPSMQAEVTVLRFPSPPRRHLSAPARRDEIDAWFRRRREPQLLRELQYDIDRAIRQAAENQQLRASQLDDMRRDLQTVVDDQSVLLADSRRLLADARTTVASYEAEIARMQAWGEHIAAEWQKLSAEVIELRKRAP